MNQKERVHETKKSDCARANEKIQAIENYFNGQFYFKDCTCNLPKTEIKLDHYKAYIMDAQDPRQVLFEDDANKMYALMNPDAGFFVIEDTNTGKIVGYTEAWECENINKYERVKKINLEHFSRNSSKFARELYKCIELWINLGMFTLADGYGEDPLDLFCGNLGFHLTARKLIDGRIIYSEIPYAHPFTEKEIVAFSNHDWDPIQIRNMKELLKRISKKEMWMDVFHECTSDLNTELTYNNLYRVSYYESNEKTLVFNKLRTVQYSDNLEKWAPILSKWCEASPYKNVITGNYQGTAKLNHASGTHPKVDGAFIKMMDIDNLVPTLLKRPKFLHTLEDTYDFIAKSEPDYCDFELDLSKLAPTKHADKSCSVLKFNDKVEPFFKNALNIYYEQHPEDYTDNRKDTTE